METTLPVTPVSPPPPKPFPLNKILLLISAVSLLLAGYFIYQNRLLQQRLAAIESSQIPTPVEPTPTPTADWKTYTNSTYGFQLSYPDTWKNISDPRSKDAEFSIESPNGERIHATVFDQKNDYPLQKSESSQLLKLSQGKQLLLNYVECDGPNCGWGKLEPGTFTQILSTFKFTDENSVEGSFCGGIAGIPCPSSYKCLLDGNFPDAGGKCQK